MNGGAWQRLCLLRSLWGKPPKPICHIHELIKLCHILVTETHSDISPTFSFLICREPIRR